MTLNTKRNSSSNDYDDAYATCERTYATLCIYLPKLSDPNTFSKELGIKPSRTQIKGEIRQGTTMRWPTAWFLTTDNVIHSKDCRRHIDWLIEQLTGKEELFDNLYANGGRVSISVYWVSAVGHGGPMLSPNIMLKLGELGISIWFDIYLDGA